MRTWRAAGLLLGVAAAGCGAQTADVTEGKQAALKAHQVALARQVGQLPSLTMPYSVFELFDDPVEISSTAAQCVVGGDINEQGTMVGFDCRANQRWYATTNVALPGLIGAPPSLAGLSSTVINHTATAALPAVTGATVVAPSVINEIGDIGASVYYNATAKWGVALFKGGSHTPRTVTFPNQAQVLAMGEGSTPMLYGAMTQAGSSVWGGFKYQTTATGTGETLTYLGTPGGNTTSWSVAAFNTHHGNKHDLVGSSATTTGYAAAWVYQDGAASPWLDLTAIKTGTAFERLETARDVNNSRKVIGYGLLPNGTTASYYRRGYIFDLETGENIDLGVIPGGGYGYPKQEYVPNSINALGHVVGGIYSTGSLTGPSIYPARGFFWSKETGMKDLNSFIPTNLGVTLVAGLKINNNGDVIGIAQMASGGPYRLFRLRINLGVPTFYQPADGKPCSNAVAINVSGTVLGRSDNCGSLEGDSGTSIPWVARAGAGPEGLAPPAGATLVVPGGINDYDVAAATWSNGSTLASVRWDLVAGTTTTGPPNVTTTAINTGLPYATVGQDARTSPAKGQVTTYGDPEPIAPPSGGSYGAGSSLGVNDGGDVVGYSTLDGLKVATVRLAGGANRSLNLSTTGPSAWTWFEEATDINNGRWVVGSGTRDGRKRAFRIPVGTGGINPLDIEDLGTLDSDLAGTMAYRARAISNKGYVVGTAATVDGITGALTPQRGFVYTRGSGMTDLNVLLLMPAGWEIREATDINDNDEVVGWAQQGATGIKRGFKVKLPPLQNFLCYGKDNGTPCDDGNACTKTDVCQGGLCVSNPACMTDNPCLGQGTCTDMATGACSYPTKLAAGTSCSDNDACTSGDTCDGAGTCTPGAPATLTCGGAPDALHLAGVCDRASRPVMPTSGLIGWWRLENDGTDSGPAGNPLLPTSNVLFTGGKSGGAASFDGGTACLSAPAPKEAQIVGSTGVTLMAWIKIPSNFQCPAANVAKKVISKGNDISLGVTCANGTPRVSLSGHYPNMSSYGNGFGQHVITPNVWHHIAVTWAPKANPSAAAYGTYYYDGQWDGGIGWTGPEANPGLSNEDGSLTLGCFSAAVYWMGVPFQGQIDEVAMYGRALPAAEIASVYSATSNAGPTCTYPLKPEIADCVAKAEGDWCQHGKWCGENGNNVCHNGVCGGGDPADNFCLRADGVVDLGGGRWSALLGWDNHTATSIVPTVNEESVDGVVVPSPRPPLPAWLASGSEVGAFRPTLSDGQTLSWRVQGQRISASVAAQPHLTPLSNRSDVAVQLGERTIVVQASPAPYAQVEPENDLQAMPDVGAPFKGVLEGALTVGPTGGATYTLPISVTPGIAGMTPKLSLVYNSQGPNGIAGQGWELDGLSTIHRCPKTRPTDGVGRDVALNGDMTKDSEGRDVPLPEDETDGVCLDGKRLFKRAESEEYDLELSEFSKITRSKDAYGRYRFVVETKGGEIRHYGFSDSSRVDLPSYTATTSENAPLETAVWAIDKAIDPSGNYIEYLYLHNSTGASGHGRDVNLQLSQINYTGREFALLGQPATPTFQSVHFEYESRPDVRRMRFGTEAAIMSTRLKAITVPTGRYSLAYLPDATELPSRLREIKYCDWRDPEHDCLEPLQFDWDSGRPSWPESTGYKMPFSIDWQQPENVQSNLIRMLRGQGPVGHIAFENYAGSQFVDLNGDGRLDFVHSWDGDINTAGVGNRAFYNNGHGWTERPEWKLPATLATGNTAVSSAFADMDGDGILDYVKGGLCTPPSNGNTPLCPGQIRVWLNRIKQGGTWERHDEYVTSIPVSWGASIDLSSSHMIYDMNGDGLADLLQLANFNFKVLLNNGHGWTEASQYDHHDWIFIDPPHVLYTPLTADRIVDVNRDGLPDLCSAAFCYMNTGRIQPDGHVWVDSTQPGSDGLPWAWTESPTNFSHWFRDPKTDHAPLPTGQYVVAGDVDGDGRSDYITSGAASSTGSCMPGGPPSVSFRYSVGEGFTDPGNDLWSASQSLYDLLPKNPAQTTCATFQSALFTMADVNGDGLSDALIEKNVGTTLAISTIAINKGSVFEELSGFQVPMFAVPGLSTSGAAFADLDGDGLPDAISAGPYAASRTWLNSFNPPVITKFPNGLAKKSEASYVFISTEAGASTYSDTPTLDPGTKYVTSPLRVVSSLSVEDGRGTGYTSATTYHYDSLRTSPTGRGLQGFRTVTATDSVTGVVTETTYLQAFPYTGLPRRIKRYQGSIAPENLISDVSDDYCDTVATDSNGALLCTAYDAEAGSIPPRTTRFLYPTRVTEQSFNFADDGSKDQTVVLTTFSYDDAGNVLKTGMTTAGFKGNQIEDTYFKQIENEYGSEADPNAALEKKLGKATKTTVTSRRTRPTQSSDVVHTTAFDYALATGWLDLTSGTGAHLSLILKKTRVEPNSDPSLSVERHTVYQYDAFGNLTASTTCAMDFEHCVVGAAGPSELPFRTTTTSYDANAFVGPTGEGVHSQLLSSTPGRFPVRTTNAAGQAEYYVYDPLTAQLVQKTATNGLTTRYEYDHFNRQTAVTERAGSLHPLRTEKAMYYALPADLIGSKVVTVTTPPTGAPSLVYTNVHGRIVSELGRTFKGGFTRTFNGYGALGQLVTRYEPHTYGQSAGGFLSVLSYDGTRHRLTGIFRQLQDIDGTGSKNSTVSTRYDADGVVHTEHSEDPDHPTHGRSERKNALGKVAEVIDANGTSVTYQYDGEGNLTDVLQGANGVGGHTVTNFDLYGRRTWIDDPDTGTSYYGVNGFGDLVTEVDSAGTTTTMTYDNLGRMITKTTLDGTAYFVYDLGGFGPSGKGKGQLAATIGAPDPRVNGTCVLPFQLQASQVPQSITGAHRATKSYSYDDLGQLVTTFECVDGLVFRTDFEYDALGRQSKITYPEVDGARWSAAQHYTASGFLHRVTDASDGSLMWAARAMNELGQVTEEVTRNGVLTQTVRNRVTGWVMNRTGTAQANDDLTVQNWSYSYDVTGNLTSRNRRDVLVADPTFETFTYDALDRIKTARTEIPSKGYYVNETFDYDEYGNLKLRQGRHYSYTGCGGRPHAVCSVDGLGAMSYDANGNVFQDGIGSSDVRTIEYNNANRPVRVSKASRSTSLGYGADGNRVVQETDIYGAKARTVYVGLGGTGRSLYERTVRGAVVEHAHFIYAGTAHDGNAFALRVVTQAGAAQPELKTTYNAFDHLGSVTAVLDEVGRVVLPEADADGRGTFDGTMSYDAWGARREPAGEVGQRWSYGSPTGRREFTGHEAMNAFGLLNMNGRLYDPTLGRFMAPDPFVQFAGDLQSYNRYSYVLNNPLRQADPTGYFMTAGDRNRLINASLTFVAVVCLASGQSYCAGAAYAALTGYNVYTAINAGGAFDTLMLSMFASYVFGKAGGALGEALFAGELGKIAGGAISGSLDGAFSSLTGKGDLGASVLEGAAKGAAVAALEAVGEANKLTDADSNGDGSDATAVEARDKNLSISGRAGGTSEIPLTDERGRVVGKATIKYSPVSRYADEPIGRVGVDVRIDVEGVDADWVQNVRENGGPRRPDPSTSHDRPGLYYNSAERLKYGSSFIDGPRRTVPSTWTAELSLVTLGVDGRYHAMKTFSYGFSSSGTWSLDTSVSTLNVRAAPFIETRPSAFQLNSVRGIGRGP